MLSNSTRNQAQQSLLPVLLRLFHQLGLNRVGHHLRPLASLQQLHSQVHPLLWRSTSDCFPMLKLCNLWNKVQSPGLKKRAFHNHFSSPVRHSQPPHMPNASYHSHPLGLCTHWSPPVPPFDRVPSQCIFLLQDFIQARPPVEALLHPFPQERPTKHSCPSAVLCRHIHIHST